MRENYLAFVVRPADGGAWEMLVLGTRCGADAGRFDVMRGRVPHGRDADEVIRRDAARYDITLREQIATLGDEPLLETRRRNVYVYRATDDLPASWTKPIEPDSPKLKGKVPPVVAHFRFVDLRQAVNIGQDEAGWLDDVRRAVGMTVAPPITLLMWLPAYSIAPEAADAYAADVARALLEGRRHPGTRSGDFHGLSQRLRSHSGWTEDPRRLELSPVGSQEDAWGLVARLSRDSDTVAQVRNAVIGTAGYDGCWTFDASAGRLFRHNEVPVPAPYDTKPTGRAMYEVRFDRELLAELARLEGGPLMVWPLTPPVDEAGTRDDYRDEPLPSRLWALPANQRLILDLKFFGYFDCNEGMICPLVEDAAPLEQVNAQRTVVSPGGGTRTYAYESAPGWAELVDHVGWVYLPNGPDTLWGDLHVASRRLSMLDEMKNWCRRTGRTWARYERRGDELVHVTENRAQP